MRALHLPLYSGSAAGRVSKCIASGLFGRIPTSSEAAASGSCGHAHMRHRAAFGVDEAMRLLPETIAAFGLTEREGRFLAARLRKFTFVPPPGSVSEVALCLVMRDTTDGPPRVARVRGGKGEYTDLPQGAVCPTQIDLIYAEPEPLDFTDPRGPRCPPGSTLFVVDYKFGSDTHVDSVEHNRQLDIAACAAALWTGAERVVPAILYPNDGDGEWDVPKDSEGAIVAWDHERVLDAYEAAVDLYLHREQEAARIAEGFPPNVHEGPWCDNSFCPSIESCPAKLAMVRGILEPNAADLMAPVGMTEEQAARLVAAKHAAERFLKRAKEALEMYVAITEQPIELGNDLLWGPILWPTTRITAKEAVPVLQATLGEQWTSAISISKAAIEEAVDEKHLKEGIRRQKGKAIAGILRQLTEVGALKKTAELQHRMHRRPLEIDDEGATPSLETQLRGSLDGEEIIDLDDVNGGSK